jgi:hypothetical protein
VQQRRALRNYSGTNFDIFIQRAAVELNFYVNTGKAARTEMWNVGINPAFPSTPR